MSTRIRKIALTGSAALALGVGTAASASPAGADGATVTNGDFNAFAAGAGLDIGGHAHMVRNGNGKTLVAIQITGLTPGVAYASHVHAAPCATGEADGHYKFDPAGAATPPNEIWPGPVTANRAGVASAKTVANFTAGPTAVSVVVHRLGPAPNKIACADLD